MSRKRKNSIPEYGKRIESLLQDHNMMQKDLAAKINIDERYLSAIITGKRTLSKSNAEAIAKVFPGTRVAWLLEYDDYPTEDDRIRAIFQFHLDYEDMTEDLIRRHGYTIVHTKDEENHSIVIITSPRGETKTVDTTLFIKLIDNINDYIEGQMLLGFHSFVCDKEYYGRCW